MEVPDPDLFAVALALALGLLVDKEGVIRAKLFHEGPFKRHTPEGLVNAAKEAK